MSLEISRFSKILWIKLDKFSDRLAKIDVEGLLWQFDYTTHFELKIHKNNINYVERIGNVCNKHTRNKQKINKKACTNVPNGQIWIKVFGRAKASLENTSTANSKHNQVSSKNTPKLVNRKLIAFNYRVVWCVWSSSLFILIAILVINRQMVALFACYCLFLLSYYYYIASITSI